MEVVTNSVLKQKSATCLMLSSKGADGWCIRICCFSTEQVSHLRICQSPYLFGKRQREYFTYSVLKSMCTNAASPENILQRNHTIWYEAIYTTNPGQTFRCTQAGEPSARTYNEYNSLAAPTTKPMQLMHPTTGCQYCFILGSLSTHLPKMSFTRGYVSIKKPNNAVTYFS